MKTYLMTTGILFGLITVAHLARIISEWPRLASEPFYLVLTIVAASLAIWAFRLLRQTRAG